MQVDSCDDVGTGCYLPNQICYNDKTSKIQKCNNGKWTSMTTIIDKITDNCIMEKQIGNLKDSNVKYICHKNKWVNNIQDQQSKE